MRDDRRVRGRSAVADVERVEGALSSICEVGPLGVLPTRSEHRLRINTVIEGELQQAQPGAPAADSLDRPESAS